MSKILFFGDIHFGEMHRFSTITSNGFSTRENEHLMCIRVLENILNEQQIDKLVFGGDMYGPVGNNISCQTQCAVILFVKKLANICKKYNICFEMLVGNHDMAKDNTLLQIHKLTPFKYFENVKVYDQPCEENSFVYLPFNTDEEYINTFLKNIANKSNKIIFSHNDIAGLNICEDIISKTGIALELLKKFKFVFQAHYHSPMKIAPNIQIAGSTQRLSFKDKGIARRNILIYDTETDKIERHSFNCPDWLIFNDDNIEDLLKIDDNNYVRVELSTDILLTDEVKEKLNRVKGKDIHIDINRISINKQISSEMSAEDNTGIIRQFVNKSDNTEEQKEALINEGTRLLEKVS